MPPKTKSLTVPEVMQSRYDEISALTDALCREKLNEEYAQVCCEMTATLARKRPSPLTNHNLPQATGLQAEWQGGFLTASSLACL
jgi:hypothetical protein